MVELFGLLGGVDILCAVLIKAFLYFIWSTASDMVYVGINAILARHDLCFDPLNIAHFTNSFGTKTVSPSFAATRILQTSVLASLLDG